MFVGQSQYLSTATYDHHIRLHNAMLREKAIEQFCIYNYTGLYQSFWIWNILNSKYFEFEV